MNRRPAELGDEGDPLLDVWTPGPDGEPIEAEPRRSTEEILGDAVSHAARAVVDNVADYVREPNAAPGYRPGGYADRSSGSGRATVPGLARPSAATRPTCRTGNHGEVQKPLLVRPRDTSRVVDAGGLFRPPLDRLEVDEQGLRRVGDMFVWPVVVRTGLISRVRATLVVRPSPSFNLTVLELAPLRRSWFQTRPFVRVGVRAVDQLSQRLRQRADAGGATRRDRSTDGRLSRLLRPGPARPSRR